MILLTNLTCAVVLTCYIFISCVRSTIAAKMHFYSHGCQNAMLCFLQRFLFSVFCKIKNKKVKNTKHTTAFGVAHGSAKMLCLLFFTKSKRKQSKKQRCKNVFLHCRAQQRVHLTSKNSFLHVKC